MTIDNSWKQATRKSAPLPVPYLFQCPVCKQAVAEADFITSFRSVAEGAYPPVYEVKNLCRGCRDQGL
jgi:hypothetical protein